MRDQNDIFDNSIEQRADYIDDEELANGTAESDFFNGVVRELITKQTTLIVGPRGCGKTHMMRYASIICEKDPSKPLPVYVSFNRYYRLEPLLTTKADAIELFHTWALARIILAAHEAVIRIGSGDDDNDDNDFFEGIDQESLNSLIAKLERNAPLGPDEELTAQDISISTTKIILENLLKKTDRKRCVLLLDDAALTLTPDYMKEFFDIFRALKSSKISPKASVYPGTTEYGSRFHPTQEGKILPVWLSIDDEKYSESMESIAEKRVPNYKEISVDIREYLKYASFGVPRAYIHLLQEFTSSSGNQKVKLNKIIRNHIDSRIGEFNSISLKAPKLAKLITEGGNVFLTICDLLKERNYELNATGQKQFLIGIQDLDKNLYVKRMFNLLVEAGLLFEIPEKVSHGGNDRFYIRYIPHISALINNKTFSEGTSQSIGDVVLKIKSKADKHPIRRSVATLIPRDRLADIRLNLPSCTKCGKERIDQSQNFCHNCGSELVNISSFETCMSLPIHEATGLTHWQTKKLKDELPKITTIGDFLAVQDQGAELRNIDLIGRARAEKIINVINTYVDEFLQ
jgi:hypothetical protein